MKDEMIIAQNELSASLLVQALHIKRIWLLSVFMIVYLIKGSVFYSMLAYFIAVLVMTRISPIKIKEKEDIVPYIIISKIDYLLNKKIKIGKLAFRKLTWYMNFTLAFILLLSLTSKAQDNSQVDNIQPQQIPPLPANMPASPQMVNEQPARPEPNVVSVKESPITMSAQKLAEYIKANEIRQLLIRQQYKLMVGGPIKLYLKPVNYFQYIQDLPILMRFDKNIRHVLIYTGSAKVVYEDNYLFLAPPVNQDGKLFGLVVTFEDGTTSYFNGERATFIDNTDNIFKLDNKIRKDLGIAEKGEVVMKVYNETYSDKKKGKSYTKKTEYSNAYEVPYRKVITYYIFKSPIELTTGEIVAAFIKAKKRCPVPGEIFSVEGQTFQFELVRGGIAREEGEIYACGNVFKIHPIR